MTYIISQDAITKISETSGTIQNTSQIEKVELSEREDFQNSIILYPMQSYTYSKQIYAKLFDSGGLSAELRVVNFIAGGGSSSTVPSDIATDDEFNSMLDEILNGNASEDTISGAGGTATVNGTVHNVISDNDFNSMLDDLGI